MSTELPTSQFSELAGVDSQTIGPIGETSMRFPVDGVTNVVGGSIVLPTASHTSYEDTAAS
jgi:hypothetical protein